MATISDAWAAALAHHEAGEFAEAEQICRQIIAAEPNFAGAWHLLALLAGRESKVQSPKSMAGRRSLGLARSMKRTGVYGYDGDHDES